MAVFVTKIASATAFGDFDNRAVFRLINQRRFADCCGGGRHAQQWKHH
jgi:hypothetical protein